MTDISASQGGGARQSLGTIVADLRALVATGPVSARQIVQAFGNRSFVPALVVPALIVVTPLSGIPLLSSICGLSIALIGIQMTFHRGHLWLPGVIMRRRLDGARLVRALDWAGPLVRWVDGHSRDRFRLLTHDPFLTLARLACTLCGAAMPFLELVPFSSSILGLAVLAFSVGFLARDGLYILAAGAFMGCASAIPLLVFF